MKSNSSSSAHALDYKPFFLFLLLALMLLSANAVSGLTSQEKGICSHLFKLNLSLVSDLDNCSNFFEVINGSVLYFNTTIVENHTTIVNSSEEVDLDDYWTIADVTNYVDNRLDNVSYPLSESIASEYYIRELKLNHTHEVSLLQKDKEVVANRSGVTRSEMEDFVRSEIVKNKPSSVPPQETTIQNTEPVKFDWAKWLVGAVLLLGVGGYFFYNKQNEIKARTDPNVQQVQQELAALKDFRPVPVDNSPGKSPDEVIEVEGGTPSDNDSSGKGREDPL